MKTYDVIIAGAGAAGLMCAIEAAKRGRSVLILERANKPGKKILMSGGGHCNFTNLHVTQENYLSHNPHFCRSALSRYTSYDFIDLVKKHRIPYHEKKLGQLFCDNKSKDIVNMLLAECDQYGVTIGLKTEMTKVDNPSLNYFELSTSNGSFGCESLVIASGGLSIPSMGASPFAYQIAEQFGIKVWPTRAGLVPFTLHVDDKEKLAPLSGVSVDCSVECNGMQFTEAMLFTHRGLSGPAMLQISSYWQCGDTLTIKLLPDKQLFEELVAYKKQHPNSLLKNFFSQHLPKRLVTLWLEECIANLTLANLSHDRLKTVCDRFQNWQIKPNNTEGYRTAEVTLGGVDCNAVSSKTFVANQIPGLYFIGEALDVTGWLGGYNFQWAWSSGHAAGQCV